MILVLFPFDKINKKHFIDRFYMVSGEKGWFPYGTDCSRGIDRREAYCIKV